MPRYEISETVACLVTWTREIEAASEGEALARFHDGEGEDVGGPQFGDALDGHGTDIEVKVIA